MDIDEAFRTQPCTLDQAQRLLAIAAAVREVEGSRSQTVVDGDVSISFSLTWLALDFSGVVEPPVSPQTSMMRLAPVAWMGVGCTSTCVGTGCAGSGCTATYDGSGKAISCSPHSCGSGDCVPSCSLPDTGLTGPGWLLDILLEGSF